MRDKTRLRAHMAVMRELLKGGDAKRGGWTRTRRDKKSSRACGT